MDCFKFRKGEFKIFLLFLGSEGLDDQMLALGIETDEGEFGFFLSVDLGIIFHDDALTFD